ncbi:glycoside hydrolase family 65 protein [Rhizosphaericola mali]|uniref:Glycoside hydrolase family 65 protein n=1 Tax=Rhizosphaericola mali TaxID=2545455 RepID=A0A5P2G4E7_9BACT|nr:glycoside hydrolase family 65 protein [Rhizosphaericola mali]QES90395.1 glycoside hydrolase family 65 protein [Rhizosphaericola mali]
MTDYIIQDEWKIIENKFDPSVHQISESLFSLGNGRMGQRGNFEESYSGKSLQGNYIAGVYYPDKTRVGWWKNGYPEYFAKVLNAANWMGLSIQIDGVELDLAKMEVSEYYRALDMQEGNLVRKCIANFPDGKSLEINSIRFYSIADDEAAAYRFSIKALNFSGKISMASFIDGDIKNEDSNYDEKFWDEVAKQQNGNTSLLTIRTKKTAFDVCTATSIKTYLDDKQLKINANTIEKEKWIGQSFELDIQEGNTFSFEKIAVNLSSENYAKKELFEQATERIATVSAKGFDQLLSEQAAAWKNKWENSDIIIEGDVAAQQAIRFNIFQLNQTYTGEDARLNIGPKGFTGEKYGGTTYWDTEAYCLPFYLSTAEENVSRNLLVYRHNHLQKAIENAAKLGFKDGAALYPMVTINGEECHNEWEITFEEIHRNAAIAFAVYRYINYTGDKAYLKEYGLDVLIGIARFWAQRVNWSEQRNLYVMLGVTGPNEYENNINNNWYTSSMAIWCLEYTLTALESVKNMDAARYQEILDNTQFRFEEETEKWQHIIENMYLPEDKEKGIFLQQDNYLDKEQILVKDLPASDRPLNQKWSWDRILRSCYIKQADVLQGFYFLEDKFDLETLRRNFDFYEPRTVHESSLSPCVHSILAAKLGDEKRAYEFYLRTSRLDLDNYNNDTDDGLHITSMAGTWMSVVEGFGGMRVRNGALEFQPFLPENWQSFSFQIGFRNSLIKVSVNKENTSVLLLSGPSLKLKIWNETKSLTNAEIVNWALPVLEK